MGGPQRLPRGQHSDRPNRSRVPMTPDAPTSTPVKSAAPHPQPTPITAEVVGNALIAFSEEMAINLARTAHSTIVYEVQDFCTGLVDPRARLIAQPPGGLPLFVGHLAAAAADGLAACRKDALVTCAPRSPRAVLANGDCRTCLQNMVPIPCRPVSRSTGINPSELCVRRSPNSPTAFTKQNPFSMTTAWTGASQCRSVSASRCMATVSLWTSAR